MKQIKASFEGAGLWPVDMERAINRLQGTGPKRKARPDDRAPLADIPVTIGDNELIASLGPRSVRKLQQDGHAISRVRIGTVLFGEFLKAQERVTRPAISRSGQGIAHGGLLTCDEVLKRLGEDQRKKEEEERLKKERAEARAIKRAAKEAQGAMRGRGRGRGRGGGRGAGRGGRATIAAGSGSSSAPGTAPAEPIAPGGSGNSDSS